ncbi:MAG: hypothetical protein EOO28_00160 [Comamonadaceae bacterium]|nr:MAG: hypothetical protein EOO28_00160 [Comamonadaceae bacterium]
MTLYTATTPLSPLAQTIASELVQAHRTGQPWNPGTFDAALTMDDGYAVQAEVARQLALFVTGAAAWKVGGMSPNISASPLPVVLPDAADWSMSGVGMPAMEAEIAVRLSRTPLDAQDVLGCIGSICVAIEMVGTRLVGGMEAPTPWKLADQQVHAVLVAGAEIPFTPDSSPVWKRQPYEVVVNGIQVAGGAETPMPSGDPLSTLPWLFEHARRCGLDLRAGDLITTGAWAVIGVKPGDHVVARFEGVGEASVRCY